MNEKRKLLINKLAILVGVDLISIFLNVELGLLLWFNIIFFASLFYFQKIFTSKIINVILIVIGVIASYFALFVIN